MGAAVLKITSIRSLINRTYHVRVNVIVVLYFVAVVLLRDHFHSIYYLRKQGLVIDQNNPTAQKFARDEMCEQWWRGVWRGNYEMQEYQALGISSYISVYISNLSDWTTPPHQPRHLRSHISLFGVNLRAVCVLLRSPKKWRRGACAAVSSDLPF